MYKTILVPVDLAEIETSRPAIDAALALADAQGGTVRLIYVRSLLPVTYMEFVPPTFDTEQQDEAEKKLAELAASLPLPSEQVSAVVRMGSVYNEVLHEADTVGADLIVVGSHGHKGVGRWLLGGVARAVVSRAPCSVEIVR